jgi:hypothetical protein
MQELEKLVGGYGLEPASKAFMVQKLEEIWRFLNDSNFGAGM